MPRALSVVSKGQWILFVDAKLAVNVKIDDQRRPIERHFLYERRYYAPGTSARVVLSSQASELLKCFLPGGRSAAAVALVVSPCQNPQPSLVSMAVSELRARNDRQHQESGRHGKILLKYVYVPRKYT